MVSNCSCEFTNSFTYLPGRKIVKQIPAISRLVGQVSRASTELFKDNDTLVTANNGSNAIWDAAVAQRKEMFTNLKWKIR